ncbi:DUF4176 domain-containing protein [Ligilactobacillus pobuzihii]|uniref:DUF4176 domain-containing protein n=1 Tax=Ligilactobacillus pobuzihii TaxID=449659 RepID=UPI0019D063A0|nr:DUF4176 domain-containing protein [Ligilactobacillus pobuzihii]MBN7274916.1 DUF4176 domain-containing protein [Ligilactobacillus pobuzihii]
MSEKLLPIGSIIYLEEGMTKVLIISRGFTFDDENEKKVYTDYSGVGYPEGMKSEDVLYFNHENIAKVFFHGYEDEEEKAFLKEYAKWEEHTTRKKEKIE